VRELIQRITPGTPVIHFGTQTGPLLELMRDAGGQVIGPVALNNPSGTIASDTMSCSGFPKTITPAQTGLAIVGVNWRTSAGTVYRTDTESGVVGLPGSGARIIVSKLTPGVGDTITVQSVSLQHA
jgi:hypothetical protein